LKGRDYIGDLGNRKDNTKQSFIRGKWGGLDFLVEDRV